MSKERRRHLRVPITVIRAKLADGPSTFFGYARDIGTGGMAISTITPRDPGSQYDIEFTLPDPLGLTVTCRCEVVWGREYAKGSREQPAMGLRFLDIPDSAGTSIDNWIREQRRNDPRP